MKLITRPLSRLLLICGFFVSPLVSTTAFAQGDGNKSTVVATPADAPADGPSAADRLETMPPLNLSPPLLRDMMLAEIKAQRGMLTEAATTYLELARVAKDSRFARRSVQWFMKGRQFDQAFEASKVWVDLAPNSMDGQELFDALAINLQKIPELESRWVKRLQTSQASDKFDESIERLAQTLMRAGDPKTAYDVINRLTQPYLQKAQARLSRASVLVVQERFDEAIVELQQTLTLQPTNAKALWAMTQLSLNSKQYDKALQFNQQFLDLAQPTVPTKTEAIMLKSAVQEAKGDTNAAIATLDMINEPATEKFTANLRQVAILSRKKQVAQAIKRIDSIKTIDEDQAISLLRLKAQVLREDKQLKPALAILTEGLKKYPNQTDILYEQAMAAERLGDFELMEKQLMRLIELKPDDATSYNALGYSLADRNVRLEDAEDLLRKAVTLSPNDGMILDSLGWVLFRKGQFPEAAQVLQLAYTRLPDGEIGAHLGEALWKMGNKEEAQKVWEKALERSPDNAVLIETMKRLSNNRL